MGPTDGTGGSAGFADMGCGSALVIVWDLFVGGARRVGSAPHYEKHVSGPECFGARG